jgi:kynurenine 3-monooxygenase
MAQMQQVTVVGAGLGGALMATALAKAGYRVDVYERRSDPRVGTVAAGRSINLAISYRGLNALREIGLEQDILDVAVPMRGRMIHAPSGELTFQPYGTRPEEAINSVSRLGLNVALIKAAARRENLQLHFDHRCIDVDPAAATARFEVAGGQSMDVPADFVVGTDGAFSAVRARMQHLDRFEFSQSYLEHGYKELVIPAGPDGRHVMEKNALHIWPRQSFMMIALPNQDGSFTCTLFWPWEGPNSFAALKTESDVRVYFERTFPDAVPLMPTLVEGFQRNPVSSLVTVRCGPWFYEDRVVLLGDAAHAVVPFYGQGANAAFEDCTVLAECLASHPGDRRRAFAEFYTRRKPHCDTLADLAIGNFLEMRDKTGSKAFLMRKKAEKLLHKLLPSWYLPLYSMVTFSRIPYGEAVRRARRQDTIVAAVAACMVLLVLSFVALWLMR